MPFVAHRDRSRRRWVPHRHDNRPFPASSQASTLPALRTSGELQRPPRSTVAIASATPMGARAPDAGTGTCPTDPPATAHQRSMAGILSHRPCTAGPCCRAMSPRDLHFVALTGRLIRLGQ